MDAQFVEQSGFHELLDNGGAAEDRYVLVAGDSSSLRKRVFDPAADKEGRGSARLDQGVSRAVSDDEHRHMEGWIVAPRLHTDIEHPPAHRDRTRHLEGFLVDRGVNAVRMRPVVESVASIPQWVAESDIRPSGEPIQ